jgi:hypothetical protein
MQREARRRIERRAEVGQVRADAERESAEIVGRLYDATAASGPPWRGTGRRRLLALGMPDALPAMAVGRGHGRRMSEMLAACTAPAAFALGNQRDDPRTGE